MLEYSYSNKTTSDQVLQVPVSAATMFRDRWVNAGTLQGKTHATRARRGAHVVGRPLLCSTSRWTGRARKSPSWVTCSRSMPVRTATLSLRVAPGEKFGVMYGVRVPDRTPAQLAASLASGKLSGVASDFTVNEEGYYVRTSTWRTVGERPLKAYNEDGTSIVQIGDVNPDFNLSLNSTFQWKGLSVSGLLTMVQGGQIYNLTRQWPFNERRDAVMDQRGKPELEKKPVGYYQVFYDGINANEYFVEDGSTLPSRTLGELAAAADVGQAGAGLAPRQRPPRRRRPQPLDEHGLHPGYDPDVTGTSGLQATPSPIAWTTSPIRRTARSPSCSSSASSRALTGDRECARRPSFEGSHSPPYWWRSAASPSTSRVRTILTATARSAIQRRWSRCSAARRRRGSTPSSAPSVVVSRRHPGPDDSSAWNNSKDTLFYGSIDGFGTATPNRNSRVAERSERSVPHQHRALLGRLLSLDGPREPRAPARSVSRTRSSMDLRTQSARRRSRSRCAWCLAGRSGHQLRQGVRAE